MDCPLEALNDFSLERIATLDTFPFPNKATAKGTSPNLRPFPRLFPGNSLAPQGRGQG